MFIYGIREVGSLEFRYVGLTTRTLEVRLNDHWKRALTTSKKIRRSAIHHWLKKHKNDDIEIVQIDSATTIDALNDLEIFWIKHYKDTGHRLLNHTDGGLGTFGWTPTEEWKKKIGELNTGRKHSEESKQKRREKMTGFKHDDKTKKKLSKAWTPERKKAASELMKELRASGRVKSNDSGKEKVRQQMVLRNHTRWHTNRGIINDKCIHCITDIRGKDK